MLSMPPAITVSALPAAIRSIAIMVAFMPGAAYLIQRGCGDAVWHASHPHGLPGRCLFESCTDHIAHDNFIDLTGLGSGAG